MLQKDETYIDNVPRSFWNCHASPQHHRIIADGEPHRWRPYFSYHGFRFAEIHGLSQAPKPGQVKGLVVHSDTPVRAAFRSSDPLLNRIFDMGIQTHLNNMHSVLEDCPHREKCQWGGDLHSSWATGYYTLDSASFYRQQVRVFYTPPFDRLGIPGRVGVGRRATNKTLDFTWSVSPLFLAWQNYQINGDLQTASDHYDEMLTFLRVFEKKSPDLLPHIHRYGDHAPPIGIPRTPADSQLIAALNFYAAADRFAVFAQELGKAGDAAWSRDLASRIRASINRNYFDAKNKTYGNGTHDSLALSFGVVDESDRDAVASSLAKIYQDNGKQFDGGFMSYYIYPELSKNGYVDLALDMLRNPDYPGIAQSIRDYDATTIFERFRNDSRQKQLNQSLDHHAMNHPTAWMLNYLAGIRNHPDETGMTRLLLAPEVPLDLENVQASLMTNNGLVQSEWNQRNGKIKWRVHVPPNSTAEVRLPKEIVDLRIDGLQSQVNPQGFEIDSGTYLIQWQKL
jgi:alpha-L-rhamnosidase